jgi:signal transduction histidine kinase
MDGGVDGTIVGDEERLALALDCLVENAVKATNERDRISLVSRASGDTALLEVIDSGVGIRPEDRERIFERFSRVNRSASRNGGTGLGLAIVKAIAEAHGGTVELESSLGSGSTFRIRLHGFRPAPAGLPGEGALRLEAGEPDEPDEPDVLVGAGSRSGRA